MLNTGNLSLEKLVVLQDSFFVNSYIVWDNLTKCAFLIDPSVSTPSEGANLEKVVKENGLQVQAVINTHGHLDHIIGNQWAVERWDIPIYIGEKDAGMLIDSSMNGSAHFGLSIVSPSAKKLLTCKEEIFLGEEKLQVISTPGHTMGGISLYYKDSFVITGDTLFKDGVGRTDLPGGSASVLLESIKNSLFTLPDNVRVFPGHGPDSTIGYEKKYNTFVR